MFGSAKSRATSNETVRKTGSGWHLGHHASHRTNKTSPGTDTNRHYRVELSAVQPSKLFLLRDGSTGYYHNYL